MPVRTPLPDTPPRLTDVQRKVLQNKLSSDKRLSRSSSLLGSVLLERSALCGFACPTMDELAAAIGLQHRAAPHAAMQKLVHCGYFHVVAGGGRRANRYFPIPPSQSEQANYRHRPIALRKTPELRRRKAIRLFNRT
jgi:hypothetical protein